MNLMSIFVDVFSAWNTGRNFNDMDARRLNDLGIDRYDVYAARHMSSAKRGKFFSDRRSERAKNALR